MKSYTHVIRSVFETPWAVLPSTLATIVEIVQMRAAGEMLSQEEIAERLSAVSSRQVAASAEGSAVAVIPIYGTIMPKANLMSAFSGGTTIDRLTASFRAALNDPRVSAIVFDVASPGGQVTGVPELAAEIRAARGTKPIVAHAGEMMASAAYWLASSADEIVATPSALVGSIGVLWAHQDISKAMEAEGVKVTLVSAGKFKTEGNPYEPFGDEARAHMQALADDYYASFIGDVAKSRGTTPAAVRDGYGQGRVESAKRAVTAGLVDRIDTLDRTIVRVARQAKAATTGVAAEEAGAYWLAAVTDGRETEAGTSITVPIDKTIVGDTTIVEIMAARHAPEPDAPEPQPVDAEARRRRRIRVGLG